MNTLFNKIKSTGAIPIIYYISALAVGAFHEYVSCILCVILSIWLIIKVTRENRLRIYVNITLISVGLISLFYLLSVLWAIDSGMAFIGFIKYLPLPFFALSIMQETDAKEKIISFLPSFAVIMTVISAILMQIPALNDSFSVAGRLAGFFQYPNTFALFLTIAELVLISKEKFKYYDYIFLSVLLFGILYSGSRTVFVLALISNIVAGFFTKNKLIKIGIFSTVSLAIIVIGIFTLSGNNDILNRFTSFSFKESTFVGRILYFYDALPVILKNPFGLGYRGYYYIQQEIQTGLYSVAFIHNDFLQLMLDIGWIPSLAFICALLKPIFSKKTDAIKRIIIITIFLHSCFDFNLQFVSVFFLYLLFTEINSGKEIVIEKNVNIINVSSFSVCLISLYMAIPLALSNFGAYESASTLYPYNTQNETLLLSQIEDVDEAKIKADEILDRNPYVTLGYSVRSRYYYSQGDFSALIRTKNNTFEKFPLQYSEYEEYCYMLINGITLYEDAGDNISADFCREELLKIPDKLKSTTERLSNLGKLIKDQPQTELPDEITDYITEIKNK